MAVIIAYAEDTGFYLVNPRGTPVRAVWFDTFEEAEDYALDAGLDLLVPFGAEDE